LRSFDVVSAEDDVRRALRNAEAVLELKMRQPGALLTHGPTLGGAREHVVATTLREVLLNDFVVRRGQIRAPGSPPSSEWDVILCRPAGGGLAGVEAAVPIESVLAVVFVKSSLGSPAIDECAAAAAKLRNMTLQDPAGAPLPAVFAVGLDGVSTSTLSGALAKAAIDHGPFSRLDGVLVMKRHCALPTSEGHRFEEGEDAFVYWIAALDSAITRAPRRIASLASYAGLDDDPEDEGGTPAWVRLGPDTRGGGGVAIQEERTLSEADADARTPAVVAALRSALLPRPDGRDLRGSMIVNRLLAELQSTDAGAAARLRETLDDEQGIGTFAEHAAGASLWVASRLISFVGDPAQAADLVLRWGEEPGADRVRATVEAASYLRRAGQAERADRLLSGLAGVDHPALRLSHAADLHDPEARLRAVAAVTLTNPRDRSRAAAIRGAALSELDRDAEGIEEARAALGAYWAPDLAERLAILLARSTPFAAQHDQPGSVAAEEITLLDELAVELLRLGLADVAMTTDERLVTTLAHAGRDDLVHELADYWAAHAQGRDPEVRTALALALLQASGPAAARPIVPDPLPLSPDGALLGASLELADATDRASATGAVATLDALLARDDLDAHQRDAIAQERAVAAAAGLADWDEAAGAVLSGRSPFYADMLHARQLASAGDEDAAEALLLRYTDRPEGVRALVDLAMDASRWERVVTLIDGLGETVPAVERFRRANALAHLGRTGEAEAAFHEVATAPDTSPARAERAWRRYAELLAERGQWEPLAERAAEWRVQRPDSELAMWVQADALARCGRAEDAWALLEQDGRDPEGDRERRFVAMLAGRVLAPANALERVAALSDAVDRTDERLEAMLMTLALGANEAALSPELERRIRETFNEFHDRFPDSELVQRFDAPETPEEFAEFAERHLVGRQRAALEIDRSVAAGESPLSAFAALGGTPLSVWLESNLLPLVALQADLQAAELADAAAAIAGPAVWDSSALAVLSVLDNDAAEALQRATPASLIPRAVQLEIDALPQLLRDRDPGRSPGTLSVAGGVPVIVARSEDSVRALRRRAERVSAAGARLSVVDPDLGDEGMIADALRDEQLPDAASSWLSAALLASQRGIPLVCDDRHLRVWARRLEIATFGTVALLAALVDRGLLEDERRRVQLWHLRAAGGRHLPAEPGETLERIAEDGYVISPAIDALVSDVDNWASGDPLIMWQETLQAIWRAEPGALYPWTVYLIARIATTIERPRALIARTLLGAALTSDSADVDYMRAQLAALHRCELEHFDVGDPLRDAFEEIRRAARPLRVELYPIVVVRALSRLPISAQLRLLGG
jgi:uncharacterized protein YifE (UPF0438 family)